MAPGPPAPDLLVLLGVVFFTFSLQFFAGTKVLPELMRLSPALWQRGFFWQLVSYPFAGFGAPGIWFLLELLILFWFGKDVRFQLGRKRFWRMLLWSSLVAAVVAVAVQLGSLAAGWAGPAAFALMQGQRMLIILMIAAFAVMFRHATILLFFVLPIQARWFIAIEVLFAFMGFLQTHDLAGFLGICAGIAAVWFQLDPRGSRRLFRETRLRLEKRWLEARLAWKRKRSGMRVIPGSGENGDDKVRRGPWIN